MKYEDDFVDEKPVKIDIDGREFLYKPTTGGDESGWLKDVMVFDPVEKKSALDFGIYNQKKLEHIISTPYDVNIIKKIIGMEKPWVDLTFDQRYAVLSKLRPGLFDKLINAMKKIDEPDNKTVKNSQG